MKNNASKFTSALLTKDNRVTRVIRAVTHPRKCWHTFLKHQNVPEAPKNRASARMRFIYQTSFAALSFFLLTSMTFNAGYGIDAGGAVGSASAYYSEYAEEIDLATLAANEDIFQNIGVNPTSDASTQVNTSQFTRYIVDLEAGDTIESIAAQFNLTATTIRNANNDPILYDGMAIRIPLVGDGIFHVVQPGETADAIAQKYGVGRENLVASNGVITGQEIFIKGSDGIYEEDLEAAEDELIADVPEVEPAPESTPESGVNITDPQAAPNAQINEQPVAEANPAAPPAVTPPAPAPAAAPAAAPSGNWLNPVGGAYRLTQPYHGGHRAWDMASRALPPIVASRSGTVVTSSFMTGGYGNYVVLDHGDGTRSLYAHMLTTPYVAVGDYVVQGQPVGQMGSTGRSTGPHLHFEIISNGVKQNPAAFVPQ